MIDPTNELQGRRMTEAQKKVREYLAEIGKRGGLASGRELTKSHARQMVAIREAKRAAIKAGKRWPPRDQRLVKLSCSPRAHAS
jgi:hypothetical protein